MRDWLFEGFAILGVHFQNWMPVAVAIVVIFCLYEWITRRV